MKPKRRRMIYILVLLAALAAAAALVMDAFSDQLQFFYSPSDLLSKPPAIGQTIRLGGMVVEGSLHKDSATFLVTFQLTDLQNSTHVEYRGLLPDLFKEKSGDVVTGQLRADGIFAAETILAKHDENYMPPEVAGALKR